MKKEEIISNTKMKSDKLAVYVLLAGLVVLPLFVLPFWGISVQIAKAIWVTVVVLLAVVLWLVGRLQSGSLKISKNYLYLAGLLVLFSSFMSSLFSGSIRQSLVGSGFEFDTFFSVLILFLAFFLFSIYFNTKEKAFKPMSVLLVVFVAVAVYTLVTILLNAVFDGTLISSLAVNLLGRWYELAVFSGLAGLLSLIFIELYPLPVGSPIRKLLYFSLVLSALLLILINFTLIWWIVGISALLVFAHVTNQTIKSRADKNVPITFSDIKIWRPSFVVLIVSFVFVTLGSSGGALDTLITKAYNPLDIVFLEVRPSSSATMSVFSSAIKESPYFGTGPNTFSQVWNAYKPDGFNLSPYWNSDFDSGFGIVPTMMTTGGGIAVLSWIIFFAVFLYYGIAGIFAKTKDSFEHLLIILTFSGALYMWIVSTLYTPISIFSLTFIMTGLFVGVISGRSKHFKISFLKNKKVGFAGVMATVVLIIVGLSGAYAFAQKTYSVLVYQRALTTFADGGDINKTERLIESAINSSESNYAYYKSLSDVKRSRLSTLLNSGSLSQGDFTTEVQPILDQAILSAQQAIELNSNDYANYMTLGHVYKLLIPLNVNGAYEQATVAYKKAGELNPKNPNIDLNLAEAEIFAGNETTARQHLSNALKKKPDYLNALFTQARLDASQGKINQAIASVNQAIATDPTNSSAHFNLGYLRYLNGEYQEAIRALTKAIENSPGQINANARYYMGLSYSELGQNQEAIAQFEDVLKTNQDNAQVKEIIANLKSGQGAFGAGEENEEELDDIELVDEELAE